MIRVFIRHPVNDYTAWKKAYDDFADESKAMGVVNDAVYQSVEDPGDITVSVDLNTLEGATALMSSEKLKAAMRDAGVAAPPTIWYTSQKS